MKKLLISILLIAISHKGLFAQQIIAGRQANTLAPPVNNMLSVTCDTIFSFPIPSSFPWPSGLASDGTGFWISSYSFNVLGKFSATGMLLDTIIIPNPTNALTGGDLEFDGTYLWFVREEEGLLYKIDIVTKTIVSQFQLPEFGNSDPNDFGIAYGGNYLWHTVYGTSTTLYKIDPVNGNVISSFVISSNYVLPIKFINGILTGIDLTAFTAIQIDTSNGAIINTVPWCLNYPLGLAQHNGHLWGLSSTGTDRIFEFDSLLVTSVLSPRNVPFNFSITNPVGNTIHIQLQNNVKYPVLFQLKDMQGRVICKTRFNSTEANAEVPVDRLAAGVYVVELQSDDLSHARKMLKL
jgi:hypothetical protein